MNQSYLVELRHAEIFRRTQERSRLSQSDDYQILKCNIAIHRISSDPPVKHIVQYYLPRYFLLPITIRVQHQT